MESEQKKRSNEPKKVVVADKAPEIAKEGKMLQRKLGSKSKKSRVVVDKPIAEKTIEEGSESTIVKMETLDYDEATCGTQTLMGKEDAKLSCWTKVFGNHICPIFGVTRWKKVPKLLFSDPKAKDICSHVLCRFNALYYYFANQLGPDIKYFAEELFFQKGQIEADGLCAVTAQIWAATYVLQFEVATMKEKDWDEIRGCYVNLVWESQKLALENQSFYELHQEFQKNIYDHLQKLDSIVGNVKNTPFSELDPPPDPNKGRVIDGLYLNDSFMLKNRLVFFVSPPHEESRKFEDFSESYRMKTIKHFLHSPISAIALGHDIVQSNFGILQSGRLPLLTPNFPVNESKFTYVEGMEMLEEDLKELFDTVIIPSGIRSDLIDWVNSIKEIADQYSSYGQWISDKINELKEMCQLCYEYADKAYSMELPPISTLIKIVTQTQVLDLTECVEAAIKPKLTECKILMKQRNVLAEEYHSSHDKLDTYKWMDFFCTEYHGVCMRLPLMFGPTEYLFHESKYRRSRPAINSNRK